MAKYRKLIETSQLNNVVCDNPKCDYVVENLSDNPDADCKRYLNVPCPKCGQNLLTEQDYLTWVVLHKYIDFINKWFSWISVFIKDHEKPKPFKVHVHEGINIIKEE